MDWELKLESEIIKEVLEEKDQDSLVPTFEVLLEPDEADALGAFEETAVTYEDAKAAAVEVLEVIHGAE